MHFLTIDWSRLTHSQVCQQYLLKSRDESKSKERVGIENGLHYRRDVTLQEDRTRMTQGNAGRIMACLNNLVIGLVLTKTSYTSIPPARRFFDAYPLLAFALISRL